LDFLVSSVLARIALGSWLISSAAFSTWIFVLGNIKPNDCIELWLNSTVLVHLAATIFGLLYLVVGWSRWAGSRRAVTIILICLSFVLPAGALEARYLCGYG